MPNQKEQQTQEKWSKEETRSKLLDTISAMTSLIEAKQEDAYVRPSDPIPSPQWDAVEKAVQEIRYLAEKTDLSEQESTSAFRMKEMLNIINNILRRMRKHAAFSETTMNSEIRSGIQQLKNLVAENEQYQDDFAKMIKQDLIPFFNLHVFNSINRNAPRLPNRQDSSTISI